MDKKSEHGCDYMEEFRYHQDVESIEVSPSQGELKD
jgi:hypothetical protein